MIEVTLTRMTENPVAAIEEAACNCYDSKPNDGKIMRACFKSGHENVLEFCNFTFHITGVSRALLAQLTRHRHAGYAVRSQRYCSSYGKGFPPLPKGDFKTNGKCHYYNNQELFLVDFYNQGYSTKEIGEIYDIPPTTVNGIIKRHQNLRTFSETKGINKKYFEKIDSPIKAYILGFLYADGCLSIKENKNQMIIVDQLAEQEWLMRNIIKQIKPTGRCIKCGHQNMVRICIQDNDLCNDLQKYGIIPRKGVKADFSKILELVPDEYIPEVIRGVFEGDGCCRLVKNENGKIKDARFEIAGTKNTCSMIQDYLIKKIGLNKTKLSFKGNKCYGLVYGGVPQVTKILKWLYKDYSPLFFHSRKAKKIFELIPEMKNSYMTYIKNWVSQEYNCVIPYSFFNSIDAVNLYVNTLDKIKDTYKNLQKELAKNGRYGEQANEDARYVLPNACETTLEFTCNLRELIHIMNERLCTKAQWEVRELCSKMRSAVIAAEPAFAEFLQPKCERLGHCPERKSCGRYEN